MEESSNLAKKMTYLKMILRKMKKSSHHLKNLATAMEITRTYPIKNLKDFKTKEDRIESKTHV